MGLNSTTNCVDSSPPFLGVSGTWIYSIDEVDTFLAAFRHFCFGMDAEKKKLKKERKAMIGSMLNTARVVIA